jgi:branched-chain amino acid transport system ATP-binding protein
VSIGIEREPGGLVEPDAEGRTPVLEFRGINTYYGAVHILKDVDMAIYPGEMVCLLGGNASGKTTTLKTILGMVEPASGEVLIDGVPVNGLTTAERVARGISMVPENRRLFKRMSVKENLDIGAYLRDDEDGIEEDLERIFTMFPRVKERLNQKAGTLSGGEQQMVAVGRALMARPKVLLMDEPSMGLAPVLVAQNFEIIQQINDAGTTVFMVEQNANMALSIADRGYVLQTGAIVLADDAAALLANPQMREAYLGDVADGR